VTDRVTLITGASAGIGAEMARVFAANGHRLAIAGRREDRLTELADEIAASGKTPPIVIVCDLEQPDGGDKIVAALEDLASRLNTSSTMPASACSVVPPNSIVPNS